MRLRIAVLCVAFGRLALAQTEVLPRPSDCGAEVAAATATALSKAGSAGRFMDAEANASQALAQLERRCEPTSPILLGPLSVLAVVRLELGKITAARATVDRIERLHIERPEQRAVASAVRALLLHTEGQLDEAERQYRESYSQYEEARLAGRASAGVVLNGLGVVLMAEGRPNDAREALDRAVAVLGGAPDATAKDIVRALSARASLSARRRAWDAAERDLREALSVAGNGTLPDLVLRSLLIDCASVLRKNHRASEARSLEARAAALPGMETAKSLVDVTQLAPSAK